MALAHVGHVNFIFPCIFSYSYADIAHSVTNTAAFSNEVGWWCVIRQVEYCDCIRTSTLI